MRHHLPCAAAAAAAFVYALGAGTAAAQQTATIDGAVVDATSQRPLAGAFVAADGGNVRTLTNERGRFLLLNVPAGEVTVRVELIGYGAREQAVTVAAGETAGVRFELTRAAIALDEVVVTGVGEATRRRELGTSVSVVGRDVIDAAPVQTVDQLLQGRVAGATVNAVSAQPGTGSIMSFRGVSSVFGGQTPVIYVDGVRADNSQATAAGTGGEQSSALAELLTSDIERIEITRGGAASTLYGSDAATGVIQIFTRRGTAGPPRITARIEQGLDTPELKFLLDVGIIYPELVHEDHPSFDPDATPIPADFVARNFFQSGHYQAYDVSISGGSPDVAYAVSGRVQQSDGIQPQNDSEIFNLRGNVHAELSSRLRTHFTGGYTRSNFGRIYNGQAIADPLAALELGDLMLFTGQPHSPDGFREAFDIFLMPEITEGVNRFQFSTGLYYEHSERLSGRVTVGLDNRVNHQRIFQPIGFTPGNEEGSLNRRQRDFFSVTMDAALTYAYPAQGDVTSSLTVGVQGFRDNTSIVNGFGRGFALPGTKSFDEAGEVRAFEDNQQVFTGGLYVDGRMGLRDRLFVNLGVRVDAATSFGDRVDRKAYPKATVGYDIGKESFFRRVANGWLDELQLRAAYGRTGKFPPPFLRDRTFSAVSFREESAPRFDNPGNVDLRPEVTETYEAGFDAAFLSNRVGLDFTYFDARTRDALFFVPEQPATGQGTQIRNVGAIGNKGIEVELRAHLVDLPSVSWQIGATYHSVRNEVTDMGGAADFFIGPMFQTTRVSEGQPVGVYYLTTPVDASGNPDSGDGTFVGVGSELLFSGCPPAEVDPGCRGKGPMPTRGGSISTRLELFQRLQLSALADWAGGHQVYDWGSYWATFNGIIRQELVECPRPWADSGCEASNPFPIRHDPEGEPLGRYPMSLARSEVLVRGDWLKLREVSTRYVVPDGWTAGLGLSRAAIYGSIRNVAVFTPRSNRLVDPELAGLVADGLQLGGQTSITISPPRQFRVGVDLGF